MDAALRRRANWEQLVKFCLVGATGYVVNLAVYTVLLEAADFHYLPAAIGSFLVVSTLALGANLLVLHLLVSAGLGEVVAQAIAIVVVTPVNFVGNKLWSFRHRR